MELTLLDSELPVMAAAPFLQSKGTWEGLHCGRLAKGEIHYWETEILSA